MTFDSLAELLEYKAEVKKALKARVAGASYTISEGGASQSLTRASLTELRNELALLEIEEKQMRGGSPVRIATIVGRRDGLV